MSNLARQFIGTAAATTIISVVIMVVQFAQTMVLARLLSPYDYGLFSVPFVIFIIVAVLFQRSVSAAVVSSKDPHERLMKAANSFGFLGAGVLVLIYDCIGFSVVYAMRRDVGDEVAGIFFWLSIALFFSSVASPILGLLQRRMMFVVIARSQLAGMILAAIISVWLALGGAGVWSIVAGTTINYCVSGFLMVLAARHDFIFGVRSRVIWFLLRRAAQFSYLRAIDIVWMQSPILVSNLRASVSELGLIQRSQYLIEIALQSGLGRASMMFFSLVTPRIRRNQAVGRIVYLYFWGFCVLLIPFVTLCVVCGGAIVALVFGPKWSAAVPSFQAFAVGYGLIWASQPFSQMAEVTAIFRIRTLVFVASLATFIVLITLSWNYPATLSVPVSWALAAAVTFVMNIAFGCREFGLSLPRILGLALPGIVIGAVIVMFDFLAGAWVSEHVGLHIGILAVYTAVAGVAGIAVLRWMTPQAVRAELEQLSGLNGFTRRFLLIVTGV